MTANMDSFDEQSLPANTDLPVSPSGAGVAIQLHGWPHEPQDQAGRHLDRLIIPETSVRMPIPESPSFRSQSVCELSFPPFSALTQLDPDCGPRRTRNIVVFGESGVGKSSVINMIAGKDITRTSNDAVGCTFRYQCHHVLLDGLNMNLWDTVGLDEGTEGTVPARQAETSLVDFLHHIMRWDGIDLLLYCVRGTRVRQALLRNYNIFYAAICRKKVPVALVVTGLENYEGDMEAWWAEHEKDLIRHGMRFDAHACVTTIRSDHPAIQNRLKQSRNVLRSLVRTKLNATSWRADEDSLISASLPDVRALLRTTEKMVAPLIVLCGATEKASRISLFQTDTESRTIHVGGRKYRCLQVGAQQALLGDYVETTQRPGLLIFYADANFELDQTWTTLAQFYKSFSGATCPIIIIFGGLNSYEAAVKMWDRLTSSHSEEIVADPTYYPDPDSPRDLMEKADAALAALVEEKCLVRFEERLTKFQKFCRHSKFFFTGRI